MEALSRALGTTRLIRSARHLLPPISTATLPMGVFPPEGRSASQTVRFSQRFCGSRSLFIADWACVCCVDDSALYTKWAMDNCWQTMPVASGCFGWRLCRPCLAHCRAVHAV